jgi:hypothetical protein
MHIGIGEVRAIELCQAQICATQIGALQGGPDQERAAQPCIAEVGFVEPRITKYRRRRASTGRIFPARV